MTVSKAKKPGHFKLARAQSRAPESLSPKFNKCIHPVRQQQRSTREPLLTALSHL